MISFKSWIKNLFEGMALAFIHPVENTPPPAIGTHAYKDKPLRKKHAF